MESLSESKVNDKLNKLSRVVEQTADAVMITDRNGVVEYVNPGFEHLTGYRSDEVVGGTPAILKSGKHSDETYQDLWATILSGRPYQGVLINRKKSGEYYYARKTITPLKNPQGNLTHFVSTDKDITQTKRDAEKLEQYAEELARSNAALDQFASVASHDLQEPLRMVVSYLTLLERRLEGRLDENEKNYLQFAVDGGRRMQKLIRDVLAYSRPHQKKPFESEVNCEEVLSQVLHQLEVSIREHAVKIVASSLPRVRGNPSQLSQLFQNLISNSIKYHGRNPTEISIVSKKKGDEWLFIFQDNGIGMGEEEQKDIFEIYQRGRHQDRTGCGIGLAICKRIVERHGGKIWVESSPGLGSKFCFTLPEGSNFKPSDPTTEGSLQTLH